MILHLFDDEKVVNQAVALFDEALPRQNYYLCLVSHQRRYAKESDALKVIEDWEKVDMAAFPNVDKVVIHMMNVWKIRFIEKNIDSSCTIYWAVWGGDMYNGLITNLGYNIYFEPEYQGVAGQIKAKAKLIFHKFGFDIGKTKTVLDFIPRVDYYKTSDEEFAIQRKYLGRYIKGSNITIPFNIYYCIDTILGPDLMNAKVCGNNIMIGNSASLSANHLYAFEILRKIEIHNRNLIVPLSYGNNMKYKQHVIDTGKDIWKSDFVPLTDFLPINEYNNILMHSSVCIYANWRQEAVGNIVVSLYLGAKVFLSNRSPLLSFYRRHGLFVFCLEEMNEEEVREPLTPVAQEHNRDVIYALLNKQNVLDGIRQVWG